MSKQNKCGRPKFVPVIPKGNFTMRQLCEANGVDVSGTPATNKNWGKGEDCIRLTLAKWLKREKNNRRSGLISLTDETRPADGGLGAPQKVYVARNADDVGVAAAKARRDAIKAEQAARTPAKATAKPRKARKAKVVKAKVVKAKRKYTRKATAPATVTAPSGLSQATQIFEAIKAEIAKPETAPVAAPTPEPVTAPVTVPVAEIPAPVAPAVEAPAPAPVAETPAPVATPETVTAPVAS